MARLNWKNILKPRPPIWERPEWDLMSWEQKMALWKRHRRYNIILGTIFLVSFFGTMTQVLWFYKKALSNSLTFWISIVVTVIMGICLYIGQYLMD